MRLLITLCTITRGLCFGSCDSPLLSVQMCFRKFGLVCNSPHFPSMQQPALSSDVRIREYLFNRLFRSSWVREGLHRHQRALPHLLPPAYPRETYFLLTSVTHKLCQFDRKPRYYQNLVGQSVGRRDNAPYYIFTSSRVGS